MDREAWRVAVHGVSELDMTEQLNWTEQYFPVTNLVKKVKPKQKLKN